METFKINVVKYETAPDYSVYTNRGREFLFSFYQGNADNSVWYFSIPENEIRVHFITSDDMPVRYILGLAKAVITYRYGIIDFDCHLTVEAKRTLGVK